MEMMIKQETSQSVELVILEKGHLQVRELSPGKENWMGRYDAIRQSGKPDIPLSSGVVSRRHGYFWHGETQWYYIDDPNNRNGTYHNGRKIKKTLGNRKRLTILNHGDILRIGSTDSHYGNRVTILFASKTTSQPWSYYSLSKTADTVLPNGTTSIRFLNDCFYLTVESENIYLNDTPIRGTVGLQEGDRIHLPGTELFFLEDGLLYKSEKTNAQLR